MSIQFHRSSIKEINAAKQYAKQREAAAAIAFVVLAEGGQIDDVTASEQSMLFAEWGPNVSYAVGNLRRHGGLLYRCLTAHTSQEDWAPGAAPSLWVRIDDPAEEWPAWRQPAGAHDAYPLGAKVSHSGKHWTSALAANVYEPGVAGWEEVVE